MRQRGDTIIEVIIAVTVFSLVAVGGITLMNQGAAMAQRSLEIGLVRDQIDAQADILRYLHSAHIVSFGQSPDTVANKQWQFIADRSTTTANDIQKFEDVGFFDSTTQSYRCKLPSASGLGAPFTLNMRKLVTPSVPGPTPPPVADPTLSFDSTANSSRQVPVSNVPTAMTGDYSSTTYAQLQYGGTGGNDAVAQGIWIQAYHDRGTATQAGYYDFYISACWMTPGQVPPVTLSTVVRLYEPAA